MKKMNEIAKMLKKYKKFLITSHVNPEGDSLGSQLAAANLLRAMEKNFTIVNHDRVPAHYEFLPEADLVKAVSEITKTDFDAALVLDCPNLERTGSVKPLVEKVKHVINIDHHVSNENFGEINWVKPDVSSVGEMIYRLYKKLGCKITREAALFLYISILTDTGSFNYSNTSAATHEIVSDLLGHGIEPYRVTRRIYENKTPGDIKLLGKALESLTITGGGKIAFMAIRKKQFRQTGTMPSSCENFVNFARSVRGVEVAVFFREDLKKKGLFHISFRSSRKADVNKIARALGGGGHKKAAGCLRTGSFEKVKREVLKAIKNEL